MPEEPGELIKLAAAAELLGTTPPVMRWITVDRGLLKTYRVPGSRALWVIKSEVEALRETGWRARGRRGLGRQKPRSRREAERRRQQEQEQGGNDA